MPERIDLLIKRGKIDESPETADDAGGALEADLARDDVACAADVTDDLTVNVVDLLAVIGSWGRCDAP
jgi:hypothetical protein